MSSEENLPQISPIDLQTPPRSNIPHSISTPTFEDVPITPKSTPPQSDSLFFTSDPEIDLKNQSEDVETSDEISSSTVPTSLAQLTTKTTTELQKRLILSLSGVQSILGNVSEKIRNIQMSKSSMDEDPEESQEPPPMPSEIPENRTWGGWWHQVSDQTRALAGGVGRDLLSSLANLEVAQGNLSEPLKANSNPEHVKSAGVYQLIANQPGSIEIVVQPSSSSKLPFLLPRGRQITWKIVVKYFDINFTVLQRVQQEIGGAEEIEVDKTRRIKAGTILSGGREANDQEDRYFIIVIDNSFSHLRPKSCCYQVETGYGLKVVESEVGYEDLIGSFEKEMEEEGMGGVEGGEGEGGVRLPEARKNEQGFEEVVEESEGEGEVANKQKEDISSTSTSSSSSLPSKNIPKDEKEDEGEHKDEEGDDDDEASTSGEGWEGKIKGVGAGVGTFLSHWGSVGGSYLSSSLPASLSNSLPSAATLTSSLPSLSTLSSLSDTIISTVAPHPTSTSSSTPPSFSSSSSSSTPTVDSYPSQIEKEMEIEEGKEEETPLSEPISHQDNSPSHSSSHSLPSSLLPPPPSSSSVSSSSSLSVPSSGSENNIEQINNNNQEQSQQTQQSSSSPAQEEEEEKQQNQQKVETNEIKEDEEKEKEEETGEEVEEEGEEGEEDLGPGMGVVRLEGVDEIFSRLQDDYAGISGAPRAKGGLLSSSPSPALALFSSPPSPPSQESPSHFLPPPPSNPIQQNDNEE